MKRIGILSDTHGYIDNAIYKHLNKCDELWHAGDIGNLETLDKLNEFKPTRAVYGNIDDHKVRSTCPETLRFECEKTDVLIKHIVGYPNNYDHRIKPILNASPPKLLIAGHSHILKVIYDKKYNFLFINPGAAGRSGFHKICTLVRLTIDGANFKDLEVIEYER